MRGCLIAAVVTIGLAVPAVAVVAAITSYRDYLARAAVAQALADAMPLQQRLVAFVDGHGRCPTAEDPGFERADVQPGPPGEGVPPAGTDAAACVIGLLLEDDRHPQTDGRRLRLGYDRSSGRWRCSADIEDRVLPAHCRG